MGKLLAAFAIASLLGIAGLWLLTVTTDLDTLMEQHSIARGTEKQLEQGVYVNGINIVDVGELKIATNYPALQNVLGRPIGSYDPKTRTQRFQNGVVRYNESSPGKLELSDLGLKRLQQKGTFRDPEAKLAPVAQKWVEELVAKGFDPQFFVGITLTKPACEKRGSETWCYQYTQKLVLYWRSTTQLASNVRVAPLGIISVQENTEMPLWEIILLVILTIILIIGGVLFLWWLSDKISGGGSGHGGDFVYRI